MSTNSGELVDIILDNTTQTSTAPPDIDTTKVVVVDPKQSTVDSDGDAGDGGNGGNAGGAVDGAGAGTDGDGVDTGDGGEAGDGTDTGTGDGGGRWDWTDGEGWIWRR